jgi:hypothetical protein
MDNEEQELQDSPQPEQETQPEAKIEVTLEDYYELQAKNKQLFARLKKVEQGVKTEPLKSKPSESDPKMDDYWKETMELRISGYDEKEAEYIMRNGGKKSLEDEMVKAAIKAKREQAQAEAASVDTDSSNKSEIEKKYTPEQLESMTVEELEKILPKA